MSEKAGITFFGLSTFIVVGAVLVLGLSVVGSAAAFVWGRWCAQLLGWA